MIAYKRKFNYINEILYIYQEYCEKILCNRLLIMTIRRILFTNDEKTIKEYYNYFCNECYERYKIKENNKCNF